jgi:ribonuclease HI
MGPFALPPEAVGNLEGLAQRLSLPGHDLLLVGDGPGNAYTQPAGWACVTYDRLKGRAAAHAGAATCGTNNFAEPAPYAQALWFHHQGHGKAPATPVEVAVVSDSELTVRCGMAKVTVFIFKPMLERPYEMSLKNNRKAVVNGHAGGRFLAVTTVTPDGRVTQIAPCRGEIEDLPPAMLDQIKKDLKRPAKKGRCTDTP